MKTVLKYPKSIWYIFGNVFCGGFSFYGVQAILVLFFTTILNYDNDTSTIIFHMFMVCAFLSPLFGAIIADSYWGKYKTIFILSIVQTIGNVVIVVSSFIPSANIHFQRLLTIIGLFLTSIGSGCILPCVSSFGGDQFVMPKQEDQLRKFFSIFYFSINAGSFLSTFITPELRKSVQCFGKDSCFPLAFGVPALLTLTSIVFFVRGKDVYTIKKPVPSIIATSIECMFYALKKKITAPSSLEKRKDWLDYADDKYDEHEIFELRSALDVMYLFIPLPLFYTLLDQQASRWTLQGTLMDGTIDFLNWSIKPSQVILFNPLFIMIFIPLFNTAVYPFLHKIGINTSLRKVTLGGMFAALSFVCAAIVQYTIVGKTLTMPSNEGILRIYNNLDCKVAISNSMIGNFSIEPLDVFNISCNHRLNENNILTINVENGCQFKTSIWKQPIFIHEGKVTSYYLINTESNVIELKQLNELKKLRSGNPNLRILYNKNLLGQNITLRNINNTLSEISILLLSNLNQNYEIPVGTYNIYLDSEYILQTIDFLPGSVNDLLLHHNLNHTNVNTFTLEKGKYIHILWQVPQFILITIAEVMFAITLLEFSFTQAPISMKSFLVAANLCTIAIGNLLVVIISMTKLFDNQGREYLFYAILMVLDMVLFMLMSANYEYKICITDNQHSTQRMKDDL